VGGALALAILAGSLAALNVGVAELAASYGSAFRLAFLAPGDALALVAWAVDVVDATGAGDAFAGAFVAAWLGGARVEDAAQFANASGALTTTGLGAVEPIPTRAQVVEFIRARQIRTHHRRE
jgi:sugar/nucleoside kinase (ribokinase family)